MKLVIDDISYDVPDELVKDQAKRLFDLALPLYKDLPPLAKMFLQGAIRSKFEVLLDDIQKGEDPVVHVVNRIPEELPEALRSLDAQFTISSSRQNDTALITSLDFSIQDQSQVG